MVDLVKLEELRKFLDGSGTLEGVSFGEKPRTRTANFWWRKHLAAIDEARAEIERLREALKGFTRVADAFPWVKPEHEDGTFLWTDGRTNGKQISIGQLRRAAALIREQEE